MNPPSKSQPSSILHSNGQFMLGQHPLLGAQSFAGGREERTLTARGFASLLVEKSLGFCSPE